ncbi:MAG: hypothetical protein HC905_05185 [Bacteroidales bacterium]|nr:hypothetical protein [Bacteroidales bacterium]
MTATGLTLSCGFGILLLDLEKNEIKDTYMFGSEGSFIKVNSCTVLKDEIIAATASGLYKASKSDPLLVDYSRWVRITSIPNFNKEFRQVTTDSEILYAIYASPDPGKDSIYYLQGNSWKTMAIEENTDIYNIGFSDRNIILSTSINVKIYDKQFQLQNTIWQYPEIGVSQPRQTLTDASGSLWIGDFGNGLIQLNPNGLYNQIMPKGPLSSRIKSFHYAGNRLFATAGGINVSYDNLYNQAEYFIFSDEEWTTYRNPGIFDYMAIKTDPANNEKVYVGSYGSGIIVYENGAIVSHYDDSNSTLQSAISGAPYTRVTGMDFDSDGNLWIANAYVNNTLSVFTKAGDWKAFPLKNVIGTEVLGDVVIDDYDNIWLVLLKGQGALVYNAHGTPGNADDDTWVKLKPKNAYGDYVNNVFSITKDLEGNIWLGTDFGPVFYTNPDEVFEGNTDGQQPTLPRPGSDIVDPLLGGENIMSIAIDGANRKWLGTERGGVFLVSADGDSSLLQFNTENSPMLSIM